MRVNTTPYIKQMLVHCAFRSVWLVVPSNFRAHFFWNLLKSVKWALFILRWKIHKQKRESFLAKFFNLPFTKTIVVLKEILNIPRLFNVSTLFKWIKSPYSRNTKIKNIICIQSAVFAKHRILS